MTTDWLRARGLETVPCPHCDGVRSIGCSDYCRPCGGHGVFVRSVAERVGDERAALLQAAARVEGYFGRGERLKSLYGLSDDDSWRELTDDVLLLAAAQLNAAESQP